MNYPIVEMFHSVQGEGQWTGISTVFIRLSGCDVGCPWCDTKHSWPTSSQNIVSAKAIAEYVDNKNPKLVVITGGEPLMHNLAPLTNALDRTIAVETSGCYPISGSIHWITLSPKPHRLPLPDIYQSASELKVVIDKPSDLEFAEKESKKVGWQCCLFLQPQWENKESFPLVYDYILSHPRWRLSLQTHKFLGVQ